MEDFIKHHWGEDETEETATSTNCSGSKNSSIDYDKTPKEVMLLELEKLADIFGHSSLCDK